MGVVYKAKQERLNRVVALKLILARDDAGPADPVRFHTEAETIARMQHPNIVQIYEIGEHRGMPYIALEYCPEGSLAAKIKETTLPAREAAGVVEQLARAMEEVHRREVVHRDLKPANVLLGARGEPKVTDFGLAKKLDVVEGHTIPGVAMGTPSYMAPEQADGESVGPAADVYGLAAILYELLTGRPPFKGSRLREVLDQVKHQDPVPPRRLQPGVPRDLETICLKGLMKDRARRYASAADLADDLRRFLDDKPILARRVPAWERGLKWARRRKALASLALMVPLALCGIAAAGVLYGLLNKQKAEVAQRDLQADRDRANTWENINNAWLAGQQAHVLMQQAAAQGKEAEAENQLAQAQTQWDRALALLLRTEPDAKLRGEVEAALRGLEQERAERADRTQLETNRKKFLAGRDQVLSHEVDFFVQDRAENAAQIRQLASDALALFDLKEDTPREQAAKFLDHYRQPLAKMEGGARALAEGCYEVLLVWAEAEAPPRDRAVPKEEQARMARKALRLLEVADALTAYGVQTPVTFHRRRARYLELAGMKDQAAQEQQVGRQDPTTALDHFLAAQDAYQLGDFGAAARSCDEALREPPGYPGAQYLQALCHVRGGNWAAAVVGLTDYLDRSQGKNPFGAYLQRGIAYGMLWQPLTRWPQAELQATNKAFRTTSLEDFNRAYREAGDDRRKQYVTLNNQGVIHIRRGELEEGAKDLEKARALLPDAPEAYVNLAQLHVLNARRARGLASMLTNPDPERYLRREWQAAARDLDRALTCKPPKPQLPQVYRTRARVLRNLGDRDGARRDFELAIEARSGQVASPVDQASDYVELAHLHHLLGDDRQAVVACDAALQLVPDYPLAHLRRAESLLAMDRHDTRAADDLDRYLARMAPTARVCKLRGLLHVDCKEYEQALARFTEALNLEADADTYSHRGWICLKLGSAREALKDFEKALQLDPNNLQAKCGRGIARASLGEVHDAVADAEAVLDRDSRKPELLLAAACVYGRVAGQLQARANPRLPADTQAVERHRRRAVALLQFALGRVPEKERQKFWRRYVEDEPGLAPVRGDPLFVQLEYRYREHAAHR
jgi:tetratricopeptide (TPR) repeat protein